MKIGEDGRTLSIVPDTGDVYLPQSATLVTINGLKLNGTVSIYAVSMASAAQGQIGKPTLLGDIPDFQMMPANASSYKTDE